MSTKISLKDYYDMVMNNPKTMKDDSKNWKYQLNLNIKNIVNPMFKDESIENWSKDVIDHIINFEKTNSTQDLGNDRVGPLMTLIGVKSLYLIVGSGSSKGVVPQKEFDQCIGISDDEREDLVNLVGLYLFCNSMLEALSDRDIQAELGARMVEVGYSKDEDEASNTISKFISKLKKYKI